MFVDDCNVVGVSDKKVVDKWLGNVAEAWSMSWD